MAPTPTRSWVDEIGHLCNVQFSGARHMHFTFGPCTLTSSGQGADEAAHDEMQERTSEGNLDS